MGEYATVLKVTRESMLAGAELYRVIESSSEADDDEPIMVPRGVILRDSMGSCQPQPHSARDASPKQAHLTPQHRYNEAKQPEGLLEEQPFRQFP